MKLSSFIVTIAIFSGSFLQAQNSTITYDFKKGQAFDIIFLTTKPNVDDKLQSYFKDVFPVAEASGYHNLKGFGLGETTQGNYQPGVMVFGYWDSKSNRSEFLTKIEKKMPDFHEQRRTIWSTFDLTYYVLREDLSFEVDTEKFNVVTTYWAKNMKNFKSFEKALRLKTTTNGGEIKLSLKDGDSPFGYYHNPDLLLITEWESEEDFRKFYDENVQMDHSSIKHVNQLKFK